MKSVRIFLSFSFALHARCLMGSRTHPYGKVSTYCKLLLPAAYSNTSQVCIALQNDHRNQGPKPGD